PGEGADGQQAQFEGGVLARLRGDRGVPDRPAVALLDSLPAAVHGEDQRRPAAVDEPGEARVRALEGEAAVMRQGELLRLGHDDPLSGPAPSARAAFCSSSSASCRAAAGVTANQSTGRGNWTWTSPLTAAMQTSSSPSSSPLMRPSGRRRVVMTSPSSVWP